MQADSGLLAVAEVDGTVRLEDVTQTLVVLLRRLLKFPFVFEIIAVVATVTIGYSNEI